MDILAIEVYRHDGYAADAARLLVNGQDLIELARVVELRSAAGDGQDSLAGGYEALMADDILSPSRHLIDQPARHLQVTDDERVAMLACECGEPGCWPLVARIAVTEDRVTWSEFSQPHRPHWSHGGLGPFVFARSQYEEALGFSARQSLHRDV